MWMVMCALIVKMVCWYLSMLKRQQIRGGVNINRGIYHVISPYDTVLIL